MLVNLLFFLAISSGSALAAVLWKKEYEDILPITITGIVLIQFFVGLLGFLEAGFIITVSIIIIIWLVVLFTLIKERNSLKNSIQSFFNYGFWLFLILYIGLNYALYGMKMHEWDEFSHWGTVVKAMLQTSGLGTSSQAHLTFSSYPPGMALFQYFLQKINCSIYGYSFSEWRLYLAYIILGISFVLPLVKRILSQSHQGRWIVAVVLILLPVSFFSNYYHSLYIDSTLGILLGAGLSMIIAAKDKQDPYSILYFLSVCGMLTLLKASGIMLSICITCAYMADCYFQKTAIRKNALKCTGILILVIGILELFWYLYVKIQGIQAATHISFCLTDLCNILTRKDKTYRATAFNLFKSALFNDTNIVNQYIQAELEGKDEFALHLPEIGLGSYSFSAERIFATLYKHGITNKYLKATMVLEDNAYFTK